MRAGLTSVTFRAKSAEEVVKIAVRCGLGCIEWGADVHARPDAPAALEEIASLARSYGVENISYGSYYRAGAENEFSAREVIAAAKRLGVRRIRVWAGVQSAAQTDGKTFAKLAEDLQNFVDLAGAENMTVATEFHHGTYADRAESALKLLHAVEGLRTYWQEEPKISAAENLRDLQLLLPYAETVHTFCFDTAFNRYPLSAAEDRWHGYIGAVRAAGRTDMPFLLEFVKNDSEVQAEQDAAQLRRWLEEK